jgi:hypothetical protein
MRVGRPGDRVFESLSLGEPAEEEQMRRVRLAGLLDEHLEVAVVSMSHAHDRPSDRMVPAVDRPAAPGIAESHHGCRGPGGPDTGVWGVASALDQRLTQASVRHPYKPASRYATKAQLRAELRATLQPGPAIPTGRWGALPPVSASVRNDLSSRHCH